MFSRAHLGIALLIAAGTTVPAAGQGKALSAKSEDGQPAKMGTVVVLRDGPIPTKVVPVASAGREVKLFVPAKWGFGIGWTVWQVTPQGLSARPATRVPGGTEVRLTELIDGAAIVVITADVQYLESLQKQRVSWGGDR